MHVVIIGAGAIGSSTAYFLSQRAKKNDVQITVIEKTGVACAASGRAGGFIARDWSDGTPLGPLSRKSYQLHGELANRLGGEAKYGYRHVNTYSALLQSKKGKSRHGSVPGEVAWIDQEKVRRVEQLGVPSSTAQVHPRQFTQTLMDAAVATGSVKLRCGQGVARLAYASADNKVVTGVVLDNGETVEADAVVVCMGPWSGLLEMQGRRRTNHLPIHGVRAHSIIFEPNQPVPAEALFTAVIDGSQSHEPEVYPRPDGTVYMCGATDNSDPLPPSADQVKVKDSAIEQLELLRELIAPSLLGKTTIRQACYLPISRDDMPFIGAHPSHSQLYLATGHSCWGILNSPVTGLMISELLLDGRITCVEREAVEAFDPKVSTLCVFGTRDNPFIWQAVVEYDSVSERNYVAGSSLKQYSQDFQTVVVHNDLHGYSQRLLLDLGHGCNETTTIDNVISWNGNISSNLLSIPSIALIERGRHNNCQLWSHKINNALALSSQHNLNITAILIADNTTYDDANTISLPTTANNPPIWNTTLPPIRNATLMPDNDIDSAATNIHAAVYFTPALYGAELKAMIRTYSADDRRYVQLRMFFEETTFLVDTTSGDAESQDDSDDVEGSNNANNGYLAYVIAAATTLVFVGMVCLRWCRKSRDDESAVDTSGVVLGQEQTRRLSFTVLNNLCPVQELVKVDTKNTVCAVCLEELKANDLVRILPCNHGFCVACIDLWLTKKSSLCPICKYDCDPNHHQQRSSSEHATEGDDSSSSPAQQQQQQQQQQPSTSETTVGLQQVRVTRPAPAASAAVVITPSTLPS